MIWIGFVVSLAGILVISKKNLPLGLICGALLLGLFTLPVSSIWDRIVFTVTDSQIILLALAMGIIPILGGSMKESGQVDAIVNNVRLSKRWMLPFSASLMGLLPMPGGALLSAPIVEKAGEGVSGLLKAVINNWFRHLFILIYPLNSALIVATQIFGIDLYRAIVYILPGFAAALILGYVFMLRKVHGRAEHHGSFSAAALAVPLTVILAAPVLDFALKRLFHIGSLATLIGVAVGLSLSVVLSRGRLDLVGIARRMKPWNFALIIIGMFLYLHIFQASGAGDMIATIPLPPLLLAATAGFFLAVLTGRVQLPASIVLPIYLASGQPVSYLIFTLIYIAIYFGYVMSPVHPCLVVTCEYFRVPIRAMIGHLLAPTAVLFFGVIAIIVIFF